MLEALETMPPLSSQEDDAYRLYNIGVAYEAMAYQAEDPKIARKFFDQAAINYGKAVDTKPGEKYFLEPQNRIRTAIAHYRKISEVEAAHGQTPATAIHAGDDSPPPGGTRATTASSGALTNDQVIRMAQAGLSEDNIIGTIHDAHRSSFDLSVDGQLQLTQAGVTNKVIAAMREKSHAAPARRPVRATAAPPK
jgi:hypothetical protein